MRDLPTLIERTRQAGLEATLSVEGPARELPAAVDLSVYRIVQEALTNVIRHAHAQPGRRSRWATRPTRWR